MNRTARPALSNFIFFAVCFAMATYFTFAAVQGDYGIFRRAEINAEAKVLRTQLAEIDADVARMENLALRLSDGYLDLDLLDEQARSVLGMIRADEIVIR
jgi:cell division protein FtsB